MRIYVRVDKVTELREDLRGPKCHLKLTMGAVIMRTRSTVADLFQGSLEFCDPVTKQPTELFVLHAASQDQLNYLKVRIQLRRNRWLLRSERVGEAVIPLAMVDTQRTLVASFPMVAGADKHVDELAPANPPVGKVVVRIEVELDEAPEDDTRREDSADGAEVQASPQHSKPRAAMAQAQQQATLIPLQEDPYAAPAGMSNPSSDVRRPPASSVGGRGRQQPPQGRRVVTRTCGSQTDRLSITVEDVAALKDMPAHGDAQTMLPCHGVIRLEPPPPMAALRGNESRLPVDALALQHTLPGYPTDAIEGLMLYCDHSQKYQRELEGSLARFHLDRLKARARALGRSGQPAERSGSPPLRDHLGTRMLSAPPSHHPPGMEPPQLWDLDHMSSLL